MSQQDGNEKKQLRNLLRNKLNERMLEQHASHSIPSSSSKIATTTDNDTRVLISKKEKASASLQLDMHALLGTNTPGRRLELNTPPFYVIKEDISTHFMFAEVGSSLHELKTNPTVVPCSTQHPNLGHPNIICSNNIYHLRLNATQMLTPKDQPNEFKYLDYNGNEVLIQQYNSLTTANNSPMANDMASTTTTTSTSSSPTPMFDMSGISLTFLIAFGLVGSLIFFIGCGWLMFYCCEKQHKRGKGLLDDDSCNGDAVKITSTRKKQKNRFGSGSLSHDESVSTRTLKTKNNKKSMNQHDQQRDCLGGTGKESSIQQAFNVHDVMASGADFNDDSERSHVSIYFEDEENQDQSELYDDSEVSYKEVKQSSWISSFWNKPQTIKSQPTSRGNGTGTSRPKRTKSTSSIGGCGASVTSVSSSATDPNTSK